MLIHQFYSMLHNSHCSHNFQYKYELLNTNLVNTSSLYFTIEYPVAGGIGYTTRRRQRQGAAGGVTRVFSLDSNGAFSLLLDSLMVTQLAMSTRQPSKKWQQPSIPRVSSTQPIFARVIVGIIPSKVLASCESARPLTRLPTRIHSTNH